MLKSLFRRVNGSVRFRTVVGVSIVLPLLAVSLPVAFGVGAAAKRSLSETLSVLGDESVAHVGSQVESFLEVPILVNRMNADAVLSGRADPRDAKMLESLFLARLRYTPSVTSVYFGNSSGGLVDAGREGPNGSLYVIKTDGFVAGAFRKTAVDENGKEIAEVASLPAFDARTRPWYREAIAAGKASWTAPYALFTGQDFAISAVLPVYAADGDPIGVFSVDIFLSQLQQFLSSRLSRFGGYCFVADASETVIVRSDAVADSAFMEKESLRLSSDEGTGFAFDRGRTKYYGKVRRIPERFGLDWRLVVVYPDTALLSGMRANRTEIIVAILLCALVSALLAFAIASYFVKPLERLSDYARALSRGEWPTPPPPTRLREAEKLRSVLSSTVDSLQKTIGTLTLEIEAKRIANDRVEALLSDKELILREVHHRIKNNMASIAGLLSIEAGSVDDERAAAALRIAESRVGSMMILYDRLYRSDSFTAIPASSYFSDIVDMLSQLYDPAGLIRIEKRLDPVSVQTDSYMPLGVFLNEAVTNAYKYAFPGGSGRIAIRFAAVSGQAVLEVSDDGCGMAPSAEKGGNSGFGLTLMEGIASQLGGAFSVEVSGGTIVSLEFPLRS